MVLRFSNLRHLLGADVVNDNQYLTWTLCVATINRLPMLRRSIGLALMQTRRPTQIVVVDASDDWQVNAAEIRKLTDPAGVALVYLEAPKKSLAAQRNKGIVNSNGDILFMLDDDSLMYPDCAEVVMCLYESDTEGDIAAIGCRHVPLPPEGATQTATTETELRKNARGGARRFKSAFAKNPVLRWVNREIFMQSMDKMFVPFDPAGSHVTTARAVEEGRINAPYVTFIGGYALTVRRTVAEKEPFEDALMAYSPTEDLDATYRFGRHGAKILARDARLHHFETARGRIGRGAAAQLSAMNSAYFTRRSDNQPLRQRAYIKLTRRRVVAEFFKDLLTGRFDFPQMRGMARGLRDARQIFEHPDDGIAAWYEVKQAEVLGWPMPQERVATFTQVEEAT